MTVSDTVTLNWEALVDEAKQHLGLPLVFC